MLFTVRLLRDKGFLIPRHRLAKHPGILGEFVLAEERDRETMRTVRVARLKEFGCPSNEVLAPLLDATLIFVSSDSWTISGWERAAGANSVFEAAYQQSWWMTPLKLHEWGELERERVGIEFKKQRAAQ